MALRFNGKYYISDTNANYNAGSNVIQSEQLVMLTNDIVVVGKQTPSAYRKLGKADDFEDLDAVLAGGKIKYKKGKGPKGKGKKGGGSDSDDGPTTEQIKKYKAMKEGKRNKDSDSDYRYDL